MAAAADTLWLVCAGDEGYAMPMAVAIYSALMTLTPAASVNLHIIEDGLSGRSRSRIERVVHRARPNATLHWTTAPPEMTKGLVGGRVSSACYLRLFMPDLLPAEADRIIYLDGDVLVRESLHVLRNIDLEGQPLGAVRDYQMATVTHKYSGISDYVELGLKPDSPYFNSGVLVLDLCKWREGELRQEVVSYILKRGSTLYNLDQDALNAVLFDRWTPLPYEWNVQGALLYLHEHETTALSRELEARRSALLRNAKIVHFSGDPKPWHPKLNHPHAHAWRVSLMRSGWFSPTEKARWAMRFLAGRARYKIALRLKRRQVRERIH